MDPTLISLMITGIVGLSSLVANFAQIRSHSVQRTVFARENLSIYRMVEGIMNATYATSNYTAETIGKLDQGAVTEVTPQELRTALIQTFSNQQATIHTLFGTMKAVYHDHCLPGSWEAYLKMNKKAADAVPDG